MRNAVASNTGRGKLHRPFRNVASREPCARARMTPEVRREIQNSQKSLITLSKRYGVNPKTVEKWRKRDFYS
jgi:transposase-like protein